MNQFGLKYIPSHLLFNKKGEIMKKYTGFPVNDEIKIDQWLVINTPDCYIPSQYPITLG